MDTIFPYCPTCGVLTDDRCAVHSRWPVVTAAHHPDDYATVRQAIAYAYAITRGTRGFHTLLSSLTFTRKEEGKVFRATPTGLQCIGDGIIERSANGTGS